MDMIIRVLILLIFCQVFISGSHYLIYRYVSFSNTEIQRKISHFLMLILMTILVICSDVWYESVGILFLISIIIRIMLNKKLLNKYKNFQRKQGEFNKSINLNFIMFFILMLVCCGFFNDKILALGSLYAWALGDAFAAIIGKQYGRKKINLGHVNKTYLGTFTMFAVTCVTLLVLFIICGTSNMSNLIIAVIFVSFVSSVVEMLSPPLLDTLTCPIASMIVLICLKVLFGGY